MDRTDRMERKGIILYDTAYRTNLFVARTSQGDGSLSDVSHPVTHTHTQFDSHPVTHTHTQFDSHPVTHIHTQIYTHTHTHTHIRIFQEARAALGPRTTVQGNVDPMVLFGTEADIRQAVATCLSEAGPRGHILNVGHGVAQGTPEENVKLFCQLAHESGAFFKAQAEGAGKVLA
jgi:hypothetical protein